MPPPGPLGGRKNANLANFYAFPNWKDPSPHPQWRPREGNPALDHGVSGHTAQRHRWVLHLEEAHFLLEGVRLLEEVFPMRREALRVGGIGLRGRT